jgi:hypothetical protein
MAKRRGRPPKDYLGERSPGAVGQNKGTSGSAQTGQVRASDNRWKYGQLHMLDEIPAGDPKAAVAIGNYAHQIESNRQSRHWVRAVQWVENILFLAGRHYIDDILVSRLARDSDGNTSIVKEVNRQIPRPVNDLLGRYVETNISLLTENRPKPRVTSKSERREDQTAAELSELTMEYVWEKLDMPELHREMARILLACGTCWMEICWDPAIPRHFSVPATTTENQAVIPDMEGARPIQIPLTREVTARDERGRDLYENRVEYGDLSARVVSPFEMHLPVEHWWNGDRMGWIMREYYTSIEHFQDKYGHADVAKELTKDKGWHLDRLQDIRTTSIQNLPLWWWERMADLVEGPGPSLYVGTPEAWENHTVVRWLDRKPNPRWPKGRSILIAGNQVIYDSPKDVGARAYDERWPHRWHPYVRARWESLIGSVYGRSLISKLLPKLKRVNSIDTAYIMWRRTVPMAGWIVPKSSQVVDDLWSANPGLFWQYDPRRTGGKAPEPIIPPPFPEAALREREQQLAEMEAIAGTEEILRGQRPTGVDSAAMIEVLRKQALASRSPILQAWDETLEAEGSAILQETIKHVKEDPRYAERIRILAREKHSRLTIDNFSGTDLSDNIVIRVDVASQASVSKEAREAKAIEFLQYAPALVGMPMQLRQAIIEELGFAKSMTPQGPDVERAKMLVQQIKQGNFDRLIPFPEDDPYVFVEILANEMKYDSFWDLSQEQQAALLALIDQYKKVVQKQQEIQAQMMMAQQGNQGGEQGG